MNEHANVIVFGGSGFIGSHVVDALSNRGKKVRVFDIKENPYLCDKHEMIVGDIMDIDSVIKACKGCEAVYNFAGLADIDEAMNRPLDTVKLNVLGNIHILEGARLAGAKRFVFASSVYVYSDSGSFYKTSKQTAEGFIEEYQKRYGLTYTILRYGSLYGPRSDMRNGIYRLLYRALTEGRMFYRGCGEEIREYIHVQDAANASVDILSPEYANQNIILTGNERMKVKEIMAMISEMLRKNITIEFTQDEPTGHYTITPYVFHPKLGKKLVVNPHIDLGQGILDCISDIYEKTYKNEIFIK
ncbi:nucleoside-diphosphate-sugar epimerase [Candidatus Magnetoovum chiemensis]|nr:nucleoside-diphosphate-sugar epimerase [Candidatus Magnetoovum chiemensis]